MGGVYILYYAMGISEIDTWKYSGRNILAGTAVFFLAQLATGRVLIHAAWHRPVLLFLAYALVFPVAMAADHAIVLRAENTNPYVQSALALSVGLYFCFYLAGQMQGIWRGFLKLAAWMILFLTAVNMAVYLTYFFLFDAVFTVPDMITVLLTNQREALEFFSSYIGWGRAAALLLGVVLWGVVCWRIVRQDTAQHAAAGTCPIWRKVLQAVVIIGMIVMGNHWLPRSFPGYEYGRAEKYITSMRQLETHHKEQLPALRVASPTAAQRLPGTVMVIVGESAERDHLQAFNPAYPVATTPWLSSVKDTEGFYLFQNAYSNYPLTVQALSMYLTSVNQYNGRDMTDAVTITDVANKAGYETWYISNQEPGASVLSLLAGSSLHEIWMKPAGGPDIRILEELKKIPQDGSHFVLIHLEGSHARYSARVPGDFPRVTHSGDETTDSYDTTILYTDFVLREIYDYASRHLNLQAMIYCSDHGEDMKYFHGGGQLTWDMVRIPLFIYLSPAYRAAWPEAAARLAARREELFTNDLMFDTVSGLMQAPNSAYDPQFDLTGSKWSLPAEKALTKGEVSLIGDDRLKRS